LSDRALVGELQLFSAPVAASQPTVPVSGAMVAGGDVTAFALTPDGTRAVYRADQDSDETFELFEAPLDGSAASARLSAPATSGAVVGAVADFRTSAGGTHAVYRADVEHDDV